jgi:hypothetical protein
MSSLEYPHEDHKRTVEFLARESDAPFAEVERLYELERAKLELDAHVNSFVPIFIIRNVREILSRQRLASPSALVAATSGTAFP